MSTVLGPSRSAVARPVTRPARPRLRIVDEAPFRPPRMPFVLFVVVLLVAGLVGLLLLNTGLQQGTFRVTALTKQAQDLRDQQEGLEHQVRTLEAPQNLAGRALKLGMVPNPNPVFLRLSDGKVLGVPEKGRKGAGATAFGPELPKPKPKVTANPAVQSSGLTPVQTTPTTKPTTKPTKPASTKPTGQRTTKPTATSTTKPRKPARAPTTTNGG